MEVTEAIRCAEMFLHDGIFGLQIANSYGCREGFRRINDTISIVKDGRTQQYCKLSLTFQVWLPLNFGYIYMKMTNFHPSLFPLRLIDIKKI